MYLIQFKFMYILKDNINTIQYKWNKYAKMKKNNYYKNNKAEVQRQKKT